MNGPLLDDIRYTPSQALMGSRFGFNVEKWSIVAPQQLHPRGGWFEASIWNRLWTNPISYNGPNLRIPYRFQKNAFTQQQQSNIAQWLVELSGYVDGCIEFYNQGQFCGQKLTLDTVSRACKMNHLFPKLALSLTTLKLDNISLSTFSSGISMMTGARTSLVGPCWAAPPKEIGKWVGIIIIF